MSAPVFDLRIETLEALLAGLEGDADALVEETAVNIRNEMQMSMSGPKSGRFYGSHQASAPGEAPAVMTGAAKNNMTIDKPGEGERIVAAGQEYAPFLEFGTRFMEARPFMSPAVMKERSEFLRKAEELFNAH